MFERWVFTYVIINFTNEKSNSMDEVPVYIYIYIAVK